MKSTIEMLKETIVDLQVDKARLCVQNGNCPFAFYKISDRSNCGCGDIEISCTKCAWNFWEQYRKDRVLEVDEMVRRSENIE